MHAIPGTWKTLEIWRYGLRKWEDDLRWMDIVPLPTACNFLPSAKIIHMGGERGVYEMKDDLLGEIWVVAPESRYQWEVGKRDGLWDE